MDITTAIVSILSLVAGIFGKDAWAYFAGKRQNKVNADGTEIDNYAKLKKLIEEGLTKDAQKTEENARLKMTNDVLSGTIETNNKFMAQVLISHGEMKKSEELCQKRVSELEMRVAQLETATA